MRDVMGDAREPPGRRRRHPRTRMATSTPGVLGGPTVRCAPEGVPRWACPATRGPSAAACRTRPPEPARSASGAEPRHKYLHSAAPLVSRPPSPMSNTPPLHLELDDLVIEDDRAAERYEARLRDAPADAEPSITAFWRHGDGVTFTHTEVPRELEGRGVASRLV